MTKPLCIKLTVIVVSLLVFVAILYGLFKDVVYTDADDRPVANTNDVSAVKQFHNAVSQATQEMAQIIENQSTLSIPAELSDWEKDMPNVERLIAEVERQTGETFTSVFDQDIVLDPVEDTEFHQLDKKFEALDAEILDVVDQL